MRPSTLLGVFAVLKAKLMMRAAAIRVNTATAATAWRTVAEAGSSLRSATEGSGVVMAGEATPKRSLAGKRANIPAGSQGVAGSA